MELSRDLAYCRIYISVLGDETAQQQTMEGLDKATGFIRSELAKKIRFRTVPQLSFHYDSSLEYGSRINAILKSLILMEEAAVNRKRIFLAHCRVMIIISSVRMKS